MSSRDRHSRRHGQSSKGRGEKNSQRGRERSQRHEHSNSWRVSARSAREELLSSPHKSVFRPSRPAVSAEQIRAEEEAIREFKNANHSVCPRCGKPVADLAYAMADKNSGSPMHFECALDFLTQSETLSEGERIAYIGQGRFGVLSCPDAHDPRHFSIRKIIDWEEKDGKPEWRGTVADLYSKVR